MGSHSSPDALAPNHPVAVAVAVVVDAAEVRVEVLGGRNVCDQRALGDPKSEDLGEAHKARTINKAQTAIVVIGGELERARVGVQHQPQDPEAHGEYQAKSNGTFLPSGE